MTLVEKSKKLHRGNSQVVHPLPASDTDTPSARSLREKQQQQREREREVPRRMYVRVVAPFVLASREFALK